MLSLTRVAAISSGDRDAAVTRRSRPRWKWAGLGLGEKRKGVSVWKKWVFETCRLTDVVDLRASKTHSVGVQRPVARRQRWKETRSESRIYRITVNDLRYDAWSQRELYLRERSLKCRWTQKWSWGDGTPSGGADYHDSFHGFDQIGSRWRHSLLRSWANEKQPNG